MRIGEDLAYRQFSVLLTQGGDRVAVEERQNSIAHRSEFYLVVTAVTSGDVVLNVSDLGSKLAGVVTVVDRNNNMTVFNQPVVDGVFTITVPGAAVGQGTFMTGVFI